MTTITHQRKKLYMKLRGLLHENDHTQLDLQPLLVRSESYITDRMTGKRSWELNDCYTILDWLNVPADQIHEYFPEGGKT